MTKSLFASICAVVCCIAAAEVPGTQPVKAGITCTRYDYLNQTNCDTDAGSYKIQDYEYLNKRIITDPQGQTTTCTFYQYTNQISCH